MKIAIIKSLFNPTISENLFQGTVRTLEESDVPELVLDIFEVPGAFEIPLMAQELAKREEYQAIICLGCVIRGETTHYDYVCEAASQGILQVSLKYHLPVIFGVLTCETREQAEERSLTKGEDMAKAALQMIDQLSLNLLNN